MRDDTAPILAEGRAVVTLSGVRDAAAIPWNAHPAFPGVSLKLLVAGADTGGAVSCHLVRVEPGMELKSHVHEGQWELHEVVAGSGRAGMGEAAAEYRPGVVAVIPRGVAHNVRAGDEGLWLFAKFFPALV
jgi:quercetin dioxygenase-like cupin family protein